MRYATRNEINMNKKGNGMAVKYTSEMMDDLGYAYDRDVVKVEADFGDGLIFHGTIRLLEDGYWEVNTSSSEQYEHHQEAIDRLKAIFAEQLREAESIQDAFDDILNQFNTSTCDSAVDHAADDNDLPLIPYNTDIK